MGIPHSIFQEISVRRRLNIAISILAVVISVIGISSVISIVETNNRLHKSVLEGQATVNAIDTARLAQVHFKKQVQEWKNILLRGNDKNLFDKHLAAFNEEDQKVKEYLKSLSQIVLKNGISVPQIQNAIQVHEKLGDQYREALKKYNRSDLRSAVLVDQKVRGIDRQPTDEIDAIVTTIKRVSEKRLNETEIIAKTRLEAYQSFSFILMFLVIAGIGFAIYHVRSIKKDLPQEEDLNGPEEL